MKMKVLVVVVVVLVVLMVNGSDSEKVNGSDSESEKGRGSEKDKTKCEQVTHVNDSEWRLTLSEEFNGKTLNSSLSSIRTNESHCSPCEPQLYIPANINVSNGLLTIQ